MFNNHLLAHTICNYNEHCHSPNQIQNSVNAVVRVPEQEDPLLQDFNNDGENFDLVQILDTIEKENMHLSQINVNNNVTTTMQQSTVRRSPQVPMFQNCRIGSIGEIHFHIHIELNNLILNKRQRKCLCKRYYVKLHKNNMENDYCFEKFNFTILKCMKA